MQLRASLASSPALVASITTLATIATMATSCGPSQPPPTGPVTAPTTSSSTGETPAPQGFSVLDAVLPTANVAVHIDVAKLRATPMYAPLAGFSATKKYLDDP